MSFVSARAKLLRWGKSFGLRLTRQDVERLHLQPGKEVEVQVEVDVGPIDVSQVHSFDLGGDAADRHDDLFAEGALEEYERKRKRSKS